MFRVRSLNRRTRRERARAAARHRVLRRYRASVSQPFGVIIGLDPPYTIAMGRQMALDDWNAGADITNQRIRQDIANQRIGGTAPRDDGWGPPFSNHLEGAIISTEEAHGWGSGAGWDDIIDGVVPTGNWTRTPEEWRAIEEHWDVLLRPSTSSPPPDDAPALAVLETAPGASQDN
ncbi:hypothetical protein B0H11DRAFT_2232993 [Mycena galericulata]|nr:hypothetical protein B0H11DRAFT_2232993 [Mycena galericulata]